MKRNAMLALLGAALFIPVHADAQRPRARTAPPARHVAPYQSGRLAECRAPANGRAYVCRNDRNVVYRYSGSLGRRPWVTPRWGRFDVYVPPRRVHRGALGPQRLRNLLGPDLVHRVRAHGRRAGLRGELRGHWTEPRRLGTVLVLTMRGQEVARLIDYDRDGYMDDLRLRNFRPRYAAEHPVW